jgi:dTDP-4-amino-4,6-dideoxygalactose transaminase
MRLSYAERKPVFVDIRQDTQNIDESLIEQAITPKTRAIVVVHYAGIACEMDAIMEIAQRHQLAVVEDNAHGLFGCYKGHALGSIGDMATLSFHETKNIICGEGGPCSPIANTTLNKLKSSVRRGQTAPSSFAEWWTNIHGYE